jgi:hypothetical protein
MVTRRIALEDAPQALEALKTPAGVVRSVILI